MSYDDWVKLANELNITGKTIVEVVDYLKENYDSVEEANQTYEIDSFDFYKKLDEALFDDEK